jgi:hypothetical protein
MNRPTNHERLFDDALADEAPAGFRDALLGETLRLARHRRRWRQARRGAGILAALCLLAVLARPLMRHQPARPPAIGGGPSCELIYTQPLPAGVQVTTEPLSPERLAVSTSTVNQIRTGDIVVDLQVNDMNFWRWQRRGRRCWSGSARMRPN